MAAPESGNPARLNQATVFILFGNIWGMAASGDPQLFQRISLRALTMLMRTTPGAARARHQPDGFVLGGTSGSGFPHVPDRIRREGEWPAGPARRASEK